MLCLVTDRRRLAGEETSLEHSVECLVSQARFAVDAGIEVIQIRERDLEADALETIVRRVLAVARGSGTRIVVNDRLDIALACGADGVHLRHDSIHPEAARRIAPPGFLIGRSVHRVHDLAGIEEADYVVAGTVYPSASKPDPWPLIGLDGLRSIVQRASAPVLAIGGVSETTVDEIARAGAAGCAGIGVFMADAGVMPRACRAVPLRATVEQMRRRFDRAKTAPLT